MNDLKTHIDESHVITIVRSVNLTTTKLATIANTAKVISVISSRITEKLRRITEGQVTATRKKFT